MKGEDMRVIDISQFNGAVDFGKIENVDGVIIRAGYRGYGSAGKMVTDKKFAENIKGAFEWGFKVGVYFVTQAINEAEAIKEAECTLELIAPYNLELGIYWDSENGNNGKGRADRGKLSRETRTALAKAFCDRVQQEGYKAGIYASESWFNDDLNVSELKSYSLWIAKYSKMAPRLAYDGWQYTSSGIVNGIKGNVDMSVFVDTMAEQIAESDTLQDIKQDLKNIDEIAKEVIDGKWGNGAERLGKLTLAGYDAKEVQDRVNEILGVNNTYIVKKGDTLSKIAYEHKTTVSKLIALNNIKDANKIYIGQKVRVR